MCRPRSLGSSPLILNFWNPGGLSLEVAFFLTLTAYPQFDRLRRTSRFFLVLLGNAISHPLRRSASNFFLCGGRNSWHSSCSRSAGTCSAAAEIPDTPVVCSSSARNFFLRGGRNSWHSSCSIGAKIFLDLLLDLLGTSGSGKKS